MKKLLVAIACAFPLLAGAGATVEVGGFFFPAKHVEKGNSGDVALTMRTKDGTWWDGLYTSGVFYLTSDAKGKSKVWIMVSAKGGSDLVHSEKGNARSLLQLVEFDCKEERYRILQTSLHSGYFLDGNELWAHLNNENKKWFYGRISSEPYLFVGCANLILRSRKNK